MSYSKRFISDYWTHIGNEIIPSFRTVAILSALVVFVSGPLSDWLQNGIPREITILRLLSVVYCIAALGLTYLLPNFVKRHFQVLYGLAVILIMIPNTILSGWTKDFSGDRLLDFVQVQTAFVLFLPCSKRIGLGTLTLINAAFFSICLIYANHIEIDFILNLTICFVISAYGHHLIVESRYKNYSKKIQIEHLNMELETKNLRLKLNPHFIFNVLTSIANLVLHRETKKAHFQLLQFSNLLRYNLDKSDALEHTVQEEVEFLTAYLEIQKETLNPFEYELRVAESIDMKLTNIPLLLIQPYVENALIHGFQNADADNRLYIRIGVVADNKLSITIDDNGVGRIASKTLQTSSHHRSQGMSISEKRLAAVQKTHLSDLTIEDKLDDQGSSIGTKACFTIPLNQRT